MNSGESPARVGPVLRTRALDKRYGHGEGEVRALEGVELEVARGETLAVMGPAVAGSRRCCICWVGSNAPPQGRCGSPVAASTR